MPDTNAVVIDTSRSPHARLCPVPINAVTLTDAFWAPRLEINRTVTLASQYRQLKETGRLDNFRRVSGKVDKPFEGIFFNDSDVYKWLEAAAWSLASHPDDAVLCAMVDTVITEIEAAQQPDGYLNTYFSLERAGERWTNLRDMHELYCAGHFFQAAVAHHRATGKTRLLHVATRFADCICSYFGPTDEGRHPGTCGHEEVEMALVELSRVTGDLRYLEQAQYFIDARGASPSALTKNGASGDFDRRYFQDHVPFRALSEVIGHAVRMVYLTCGATDLYAETGEDALKDALDRQWENMTGRRMYVTGGLGARHEGEAFGGDYELPSNRAYAETCAAIASVMWNYRMLQLTGEAKYADLMELALYNGVLAGLSLDGTEYYYVNPLADDGTHRRQPWYGCACCPPNVARLMASLPGYFYSVAQNSVYVHLYASGTATIALPDGASITLTQKTKYPWDGEVTFTVEGEGEWSLFLRIPAWAERGASVEVDGPGSPLSVTAPEPGAYVEIRRHWKSGDTVRLVLSMPERRVVGHPFVSDTRGSVALTRGPLVYCLEHADNPGLDIRSIALPPGASLAPEWEPDKLGGVVVLSGEVVTTEFDWGSRSLYCSQDSVPEIAQPTVTVTAIPYYAWANREAGPMRVWIPVG